jgi:diaminopimelate decarboxylase
LPAECGKQGAGQPARQSQRRPKTHPYISTGLKENKFGVAYEDALASTAAPPRCPTSRSPASIATSARSCSTRRPSPKRSTRCWLLVDQLRPQGIRLRHIDLGGGLGIRYKRRPGAPTVASYLAPLLDKLAGRG